MKKSTLLTIVALVLALAMGISGTMAYLQDQDADVNVMTLGNVYIEQIEEQLAADGSTEPYQQHKPFFPGCEISKIVSVENTGKSDAYFRTLFAFESVDSDTFEINFPISEKYTWSWGAPEAVVEINGKTFEIYEALYKGVLAPGETSPVSLTKVEMGAAATNEDMEALGGNYEILVVSQAVQTAGFASAQEALDAAFGDITATNHPWLGVAPNDAPTFLPDTSWYDDAQNEFVLTTADELFGLAELVNGGNSMRGKTIKLGADINLAGKVWTPMGSEENPFSADFDGQDHTLSNLTVSAPDTNCVGFIGYAAYADIKGINVHNASVAGYSQVGTIVGTPYVGCTITDCHVTGDINLYAEYAYAGGICAYGYVDIKDCSVIADTIGHITVNEKNAVGGICAWVLENGHEVTNCHVKNLELTGWANIGSITGFLHYNNVMQNCTAENMVLTKTREGGNPSIGAASGGWCYHATNKTTFSNNTFKNITLNARSIAYDAVNDIYGSAYYGESDVSNIVLENNVLTGLTDNRIIVTP